MNIQEAAKEWAKNFVCPGKEPESPYEKNMVKLFEGQLEAFYNSMTPSQAGAIWQEQQGWVRVEDGLPEDNEDRQVWEKGALVPSVAHYLTKEYFLKNYDDENYMEVGWYYSFGYVFDDLLPGNDPISVTHWRPLPSPPGSTPV